MANDTLKNKVRFSSTLPPEVDKMLKDYSKQTMIPISKIVEVAIVEYISRKGEK
ncbi:MAG: ribbon-helix-helix domain-containing protein [Lachnospiraceae bacterium]|nr:ribbon-helix-helix domain-containing protein [Lachnospiraceae bacterium]